MRWLLLAAVAAEQPRPPFAQYKPANNIISATGAVLQELKERYEFLAVGFHSPACAACGPFKSAFAEVALHFAKAAPLLPFALLNCEAESQHCQPRERVSHLPLFRLFYRQQSMDLRARATVAEMTAFVERRVLKACLRLTDVNWSLAKLLDRGEVSVLFLGDPASADFAEFRAVAFLFEAAHFFFTADTALQAAARGLCTHGVNESAEARLLLLDPDHRTCHYFPGRLERRAALEFLAPHVKPGLGELNRRLMNSHAAYRQPVVVFFAAGARTHPLFGEFTAASKAYKSALLFAFVDTADPLNVDARQAMDLVGVGATDAASLRAFSTAGVQGREKWRPARALEPEALHEFVAELAAKKLSPYRKGETAEQISAKNERAGAIRSISAAEFKDAVTAASGHCVLLLVVGGAESCPLCARFEAAVEAALRRRGGDQSPYIEHVVLKMDAQRNEVQGWAFETRPDLILFRGANVLHNLAQSADAEAIARFIDQHLLRRTLDFTQEDL